MDEVQCGHFRTGRFQSFQRILEQDGGASSVRSVEREERGEAERSHAPTLSRSTPFLPDGISMAKSLGGGFPIGAFWVRHPYADLLGPGTHATTYGGTPLGCAVALKILEVIQRDKLADNARSQGDFLIEGLGRLTAKFPQVLNSVRGLGLMIGFE